MAHQIESDDSMFSVRETPWHGLGKVVKDAPTTREAITMAGLDWKVETKTMAVEDSGDTVPGFRAVVRDSDTKVLGVVSSKWKPLQNDKAFEWFQPWVDSGSVTLETAGSLRGGQIVWVLAKVAGDAGVVVPKSDDKVIPFILLSNSHDGTRAVRAGFTPIRVVCANTLAIAHGGSTGKLLKVRHTASVVDAVQAVRESMDLVQREFVATIHQYRTLAMAGVDAKSLDKYVRRVFNLEADEDNGKRILNKVIPLFEGGKGNQLAGVCGTYWAAYNAVAEFLAYERGNSQDNRLASLWFGDSSNTNARALQVGLEMVREAA